MATKREDIPTKEEVITKKEEEISDSDGSVVEVSFLQAPLTKAGERRKRRRALESQYDNQEQLAMLRRAEGDVRAMRRQIRQGAEAAGLPIPPEAAKLPAGKGRGQHTQWWSGKGGYNFKGWKGYGTSDYCKGGYGTDDCGYKGGYGGYKG